MTPLEWIESTRLARGIAESQLGIAALSATHLVGLTILMGSVWVSGLTLLGFLFAGRPVADVVRPAQRGVLIGLTISVLTGALLFAARATAAAANTTFQLKMLLLAAAVAFHVLVFRRVTRVDAGRGFLRLTGASAIALWLGVTLAGCAYILLE